MPLGHICLVIQWRITESLESAWRYKSEITPPAGIRVPAQPYINTHFSSCCSPPKAFLESHDVAELNVQVTAVYAYLQNRDNLFWLRDLEGFSLNWKGEERSFQSRAYTGRDSFMTRKTDRPASEGSAGRHGWFGLPGLCRWNV